MTSRSAFRISLFAAWGLVVCLGIGCGGPAKEIPQSSPYRPPQISEELAPSAASYDFILAILAARYLAAAGSIRFERRHLLINEVDAVGRWGECDRIVAGGRVLLDSTVRLPLSCAVRGLSSHGRILKRVG